LSPARRRPCKKHPKVRSAAGVDAEPIGLSLIGEDAEMIQRLRMIIAFTVAALLMLITFNQIKLNPTGRATASDDSDSTRAAITRPIEQLDPSRRRQDDSG
jgi:hypothetical protein